MPTSTLIEWNQDGVSQCYINTACNSKLILYDEFSNIISVPNMLSLFDFDTFIKGPSGDQTTLYIEDIDFTQSGSGV